MNINSKEIADFLESTHFGNEVSIELVKPINQFEDKSLSFATKELSKQSREVKGFLILSSKLTIPPDNNFSYVLSENPRLDFARVLENFIAKEKPIELTQMSFIDPSATISKNVTIGLGCYIGKNSVIGEGTTIRNNVSILDSVVIGKNCYIKSNTVIGEKGFGFEADESLLPVAIPHIGGVEIGDNVELGSFNSIVRGTIDPTIIGSYTKTDDHVHIAHNCVIGEACMFTASASVGGSVKAGKNCWFGLNCTVMNGLTLGSYIMIGTHTNVIKNVQDFELLAGSPARRLGWVSKAREKLDLPPEGSGEAVCPKKGTRYVLEKNILREDS